MIPSDKPIAALRLAAGGTRDLDRVMTIMDSAFDRRFGEAWTRSQCAGILPMSGVSLVLAFGPEGELPVGFALCRTVADEAELLLLAVARAHQRKGVGRRLLDQFVESARRAAASRVHLEVREGNEAMNMYRSAGFTLAGRRSKYYRGSDGSQYDALTLTQEI